MDIISFLEARLVNQPSLFQAQLLREDLERIRQLESLAKDSQTLEEFIKAGLYIGWTKGDFRTHELKEPLTGFLDAFYAQSRGQGGQDGAHVVQAWSAFNKARLGILVGCL